jgi:arsenate reductase (thioredoxin)
MSTPSTEPPKELRVTAPLQPMSAALAGLTAAERINIRQSAAALEARWKGRMNVETIERFMAESLDLILPRARIRTWVPVLAERLTDDRLRALVRLESGRTDLHPSVLFLCVHNAGRSQMAAGWMRHLGGDRVDVFSGGSEPATELNEAAVAAMAEKGIDIGRELPQPWADEIVRAADVVVTMGCGDACPVFPGKRYLDWELEDPAGRPVEEVRRIRDEIERRVRTLMGELAVEAQPRAGTYQHELGEVPDSGRPTPAG